LPKKLPPLAAPIPVNGLPVVGYLEQSVASSLTEALSDIGKFKPKYPFKSLKQSAAEYLGLYLKCK
jgi:adenylate/nucleoside-diphosphate kinase